MLVSLITLQPILLCFLKGCSVIPKVSVDVLLGLVLGHISATDMPANITYNFQKLTVSPKFFTAY